MKKRLIKKIFKETYNFRWLKKLISMIKIEKQLWLFRLRNFSNEMNNIEKFKKKLFKK